MRISVETATVDQVPLITMVKEGARHCPLVFYVHSYHGEKTLGMRLGYKLAEAGIFFVTLDAYMHGDRVRWVSPVTRGNRPEDGC